MSQEESDIKTKIKEYLAKSGWYVHQINQFNKRGYKIQSGMSDLIACKNTVVLFIEVKTKTGTQRPSQIIFMENILMQKCHYFIARCVEDVKFYVDKL